MKYTFFKDYFPYNRVMILLLMFSISLAIHGYREIYNGDSFTGGGVLIADSILTSIWILCFTIDFFRMKSKAKKGQL